MRYFGCHVSAAGGLVNAVYNGEALGVNSIQIHPTPPQRWNRQPFAADVEKEFLIKLPTSGIQKVFFHGIYLINLASPDKEKVKQGVQSLKFYLDLMERIDGAGVIFHVGSNKDQELESVGLEQATAAINRVFRELPGKSLLLLEVSAGSGKVIGARMEDLREIYDGIENKDRVGFALDTQHMWASGYDIKDDCAGVVSEIDAVFGADRVHIIHLNDSKSDLGSRIDRHENLGQGKIGLDALREFINNPKLKHIPVILETPAMKDLESAKAEVQVLREII